MNILISYFPIIYPDEIFYSIFARYHRHSGNKSIDTSAQDIFGRTSKRFIIDLPNDLNHLASQITNYTSEEIIYNHTLYNYYAPFIPCEKQQVLMQRMKDGNGTGISNLVGNANSLKSRGEYLYYCPQCAVQENDKYGESYFHRLHQAPGVLICTKHFCHLKKYPTKVTGEDVRMYHACNFYNLNIEYDDATTEKYYVYMLKFAKAIEYLLEGIPNSTDPHEIYKRYLIYMDYKGILLPNHNVNQTKLLSDLKDYYGDFLKLIDCEVNDYRVDSWLNDITRKPDRSHKPLRHVLLIQFLEPNFPDFFNKYLDFTQKTNLGEINKANKLQECKNSILLHIQNNPNTTRGQIYSLFAAEKSYIYNHDPKWLERNLPRSRLLDHNCVNTLYNSKQILLDYIRKHPYCTRTQVIDNCRNEYEQCKQYDRIWFEKNLPLSKKVREHNFTEKLEHCRNVLIKYIAEHPNCNRTELHEIFKTEYSWLHRNDVEWFNNMMEQSKYSQNKIENKLEANKIKLLEFVNSNPNCTRLDIRRSLDVEYRYCYNYDRDWFEKEMPIPLELSHRSSKINFVDWENRDYQILEYIKHAFSVNENTFSTKKLTISKIVSSIPAEYKGSLKYSLDKLPRTKKYIDDIINQKL